MYLDKKLCHKITYEENTNPYIVKCGSVMARSVKIKAGVNSSEGILTLCEVQVFSADPPGQSQTSAPL